MRDSAAAAAAAVASVCQLLLLKIISGVFRRNISPRTFWLSPLFLLQNVTFKKVFFQPNHQRMEPKARSKAASHPHFLPNSLRHFCGFPSPSSCSCCCCFLNYITLCTSTLSFRSFSSLTSSSSYSRSSSSSCSSCALIVTIRNVEEAVMRFELAMNAMQHLHNNKLTLSSVEAFNYYTAHQIIEK